VSIAAVSCSVVTKTAVAVVGGGISGLSAALALHKQGRSYLVLEASERLGGVIRTESEGGFLLEAGPDALLAQKPHAVALCRELGLGERLVPTNPSERAVYVLHRGVLHPLPDGMMLAVPTKVWPFLRSGLFSWPGKLRMGLDLVIPGRDGDGDESIASFLRRRFGQQAVDRLGEPLLAGIHAGDPERLSILATFPRFRDLERAHGSLVRGAWAQPRPARRDGEPAPTAFYSLRGGLAELVAALTARLDPAALRTRAVVREIAQGPSGFAVRLEDGERIEAKSVVVAAPGPRIAPALEALIPRAAATLGAVPFASSATVLLGYRRAEVGHPLDGYGLVVPAGERLRTSALSFVSTKLPHRAPAGHVLLRGFLGGVRDPDALSLTDDEMIETVTAEMKDVLGLAGQPVTARVFRWPAATPQLEVGHLERMREAEREVASVPGLFLVGAGVRSTGIPDCVADGTRAGEAAGEVAR
jgi:oxygen-dependent protoporphyrinogen oxidase